MRMRNSNSPSHPPCFRRPRWDRVWLAALLWAAWAVVGGAQAEEPPRELRVLSYNIHHAEGVDGRLDVPRIARVIQQSAADLVALQEVDQNVSRSDQVDQPSELAKALGMHVVFGKNIPLQGGAYGNAVLSRWPIESWKNHLLPCLDDGEQRGVLQAEIRLPGDRLLVLLATHFDHRRDDRERVASAKYVNEQLAGLTSQAVPRRTVLLVGDLNATPDSRPLAVLAERWQRTNDSPLATIPVDNPTRQIDYILHAESRDEAVLRPWAVVDTQVLEETVASDHRPILAVFRW